MDFNKEIVLMGRRGLAEQPEDSGYKNFLHPSEGPVDYLTQENREWNRRHRSSTDYSNWMEKEKEGFRLV